MTKQTRHYSEYLRKFWFTAAALLVFLRLPSLFEPYWYGDEGIYLVLGQALRRGLVLYRDIHDNKPPLLYYLAAFGQTVFGFRLLLLLVMFPTVYVFYRLALRLIPHIRQVRVVTLIFIIMTSIPLIEGNLANAEIFMLLPTMLGVYYLLQAKTYTLYFLSGIFLGLAFVIKIPVFVEAGFLGLWLVSYSLTLVPKISFSFNRFKSGLSLAGLMALGFLFPVVLFGLYYYFQGVLPQYLNAALFQNFGYLSSWATGSHSGSATQGGILVRTFLLLAAWFGLFWACFRFRLSRPVCFTAAWFAAAIYGAVLSTRPYPHYLIQVLPPLTILLAYFGSTLKNKLLPLLAVFLLLFTIWRYHFYFYPTLSYYRNFYSLVFLQKPLTEYYRFFGPRVSQNYAIASYLKKTLASEDRNFVWGDEPYLYALSGHLPVGRFTVAYHIIDFNARQETINKLRAWTPAAVVVYPMSGRDFPELFQFLRSFYIVDRQFGDAYIFRLP